MFLNYRDGENGSRLPVVLGTARRLLDTGTSTHQKTRLLKKAVEVEKTNAELNSKQHEFRERMVKCARRRTDIQKKQQLVSWKICLLFHRWPCISSQKFGY